jgi:glycosyltransferase involved in cell wall biosynthesis
MTSSLAKRPRVLQVITHLALGGAERVAFSLMHGLQNDFDFAVFAVSGIDPGELGQSMKRELDEMRIPIYTGTKMPIKLGGMFLAGAWMASVVKKFQPDLIHLHTEIPESVYASMITLHPRLGEIPLVRTIHNTIYWNPWRKLGRWCDRRMPRSYIAAIANDVIAPVQELRDESGAGPFPQPPMVIFNGVAVHDQPRAENRLPGQCVRILFAGRFEDQKGADLLPGIVRKIQLHDGRICELIIHGSGAHEAALRQLAANPPPGWMIEVHGPVANLSARMPQFDLLIMPSRYEGLGLLAVEAALLNLPVIATNAAGLREVFPENYPWLAKPGDAEDFARLLQRALDEPTAMLGSIRQAREFAAKRFDPTLMCDGYRKLFTQAIASHSVK